MDKKGKGDQNSENPADSKSSGSGLGLMLYCKFPKKYVCGNSGAKHPEGQEA